MKKMNCCGKIYGQWLTVFTAVLLASCTGTVSTENRFAGKLTATHRLVVNGEKKFQLDDETAPAPTYMQMLEDSSGTRIMTFLNPRRNAIYFYGYESGAYLGNTRFEREGPNAILRLGGYHIRNMDSIYAYNMPRIEIALADSAGRVKHRMPLWGGEPSARINPALARYYPQFLLNTVTPFIETQGKLLMTGMSPFSIPDTMIDRFRFTACIDLKTHAAEFIHTYPEELYGANANWEYELPTHVYPELSPDGKLIYSFPVSHDLYMTGLEAESSYRTVYAGSNTAGTIHAIGHEPRGTTDREIIVHYFQEDMYAAIRYDPWRKVYYRFLLPGIPDATSDMRLGEKSVIVILLDGQFNYLGETLLGKAREWNWTNSFVTREGLNIEYLAPADRDDSAEEYLNLKILTIEKL